MKFLHMTRATEISGESTSGLRCVCTGGRPQEPPSLQAMVFVLQSVTAEVYTRDGIRSVNGTNSESKN